MRKWWRLLVEVITHIVMFPFLLIALVITCIWITFCICISGVEDALKNIKRRTNENE